MNRYRTARYEERFEVEDSDEWSAAMAEYNREADAITAALFRAQGEPGLAHLYLTDRRAFDRRMERGRQPLRAAERRARRPICGPRGSSTDPSPGCAKRSGRVVAPLSRHPARRPGSCTRNPARGFSTPLRPTPWRSPRRLSRAGSRPEEGNLYGQPERDEEGPDVGRNPRATARTTEGAVRARRPG